MPAPSHSKSHSLISIQILRALAATLVLVGHALHDSNFIAARSGQAELYQHFMDFGLGVDIFFVISGFIMLYTTAGKFGTPGAARQFLIRRLQRIAPLYWLMTAALIVGALIAPKLLNVPIEGWRPIVESYLFIPGLRANGEVRPILALGWTLNYEMFFYVLFAAVLFLPLKRGLLLLTAFFVCFVAAGALVQMPTTALAFWSDSIIFEFLFGVAVALLFRANVRLSAPVALLLFVAGAVLAVGLGPLWGVSDTLPRFVSAGIPAAMIVFAAACGPRLPASWFIAPLVLIGDASYSLYLSHPFVIRPLRNVWMMLPPQLPVWAYVVACCAAAILGAIAVYWLIERPLIRLFTDRERGRGKATQATPDRALAQ
jgi:peptidoglycan/LPS O-acetylase OafA/YrhL